MASTQQAPRRSMGSKSCAPHRNTRGMNISWLGCRDLPDKRRHGFWIAGRSSEDANKHQPRIREPYSVDSVGKTVGPSFPKFLKLPKELRLKVWKMAAEEPRAVIIYSTKREGDDMSSSFFSSTPPPAILQVCTESRGVALTKYDVLSMAKSEVDSESGSATVDGSISSMFINLARDAMYFRADLENRSSDGESCIFKFVATIPPLLLERIKLIGIDINTTGNCYACDWKFLAKLPGLEVLLLARENSKLDLDGYLSFTPLRDEDNLGFVEDYMINFGSVHPNLSDPEEKAATEVVEEIKTDCIWWWDDEELQDFEVARKPEVCVVLVENS